MTTGESGSSCLLLRLDKHDFRLDGKGPTYDINGAKKGDRWGEALEQLGTFHCDGAGQAVGCVSAKPDYFRVPDLQLPTSIQIEIITASPSTQNSCFLALVSTWNDIYSHLDPHKSSPSVVCRLSCLPAAGCCANRRRVVS